MLRTPEHLAAVLAIVASTASLTAVLVGDRIARYAAVVGLLALVGGIAALLAGRRGE